MNGNTADRKPRNPYAKRAVFPGAAFFKVPTQLYDGGYAARLRASTITRYFTLLRVSNFNYGENSIPLTAHELELLDGISPRTARHVNGKLLELGLLRRNEANPRIVELVHPWDWEEVETVKPRLYRLPSGKLICRRDSKP